MVTDQTQERIAATLGRLALRMQAEPNPEATLRAIVSSISEIVPGISWAGVSIVGSKSVTSGAATDDVARLLDKLQTDLGEGPTMDALAQQGAIVITDLAAEARWPRFVGAATDLGVHCLAAFRLFVDRGGNLGALTVYGPQPDVLDSDAVLHCELLAQHAAVAMAGALAEEQMHRAIASRDVIGQAKGIIMERFHVDANRAFEMLVQLSKESNVKLTAVAQQVIDTTDVAS